ncbi:MAG: hypothetical protein ABI183_09410, partial [Polyangiaceae bacterium]
VFADDRQTLTQIAARERRDLGAARNEQFIAWPPGALGDLLVAKTFGRHELGRDGSDALDVSFTAIVALRVLVKSPRDSG